MTAEGAPAGQPRRPLRTVAVVLAAALVALAFLTLARNRRPEPPVLGTIPPFELVDHAGRPFGSAHLAGAPYVADFVFTSCPAVCPRMTASMRRVDLSLDRRSRARLVSITVDPETDTPAVLATYAERHQASPRWRFLTIPEDGDPQAIYALAREGFKLAVEPTPPPDLASEVILHSNRFVLVDGRGNVRGYYDPFDDDDLERLLADLERVGG